MSFENLIWGEKDFDFYRSEFILTLENRLKHSLEMNIPFNILANAVKTKLEQKYSPDSLVESRENEQDFDSFLKNYSQSDLEYAYKGLQYDLPTAVILHLSREKMMALFISLGKLVRTNHIKFLKPYINKGETLLEIISRIISGNLSNPNLLKRDYYPKRDVRIVYSEEFNFSDFISIANQSFFDYCKINKTPRKDNGSKAKRHERMKKSLERKGFSNLFYEVQIGNYFIDAVAFDNRGNIYIYEFKSGFNRHDEGIEQLQRYGALIYRTFGIIPKLRLVYLSFNNYTETEVKLKLNPRNL
ncbi:MAG: hypothetical protein QXR96_00875 [Candidatus Woesearchaeota archaeon]